MSYKVLYRKYRPTSFDKIIGQKNIVETLKNSIISNNFSHAYIFTGPRGTGKTSTAKVLAKAINCSNPKDGEPCQKCENCTNFNTTPDIIEIDAASNNGVDEIRELRNNITLAPTSSKYKIYIIDEVHMLSSGAFNALLKTLEEPPPHAIFILATTEVYKVPITILSRCQRYDFKKINFQELTSHLKEICRIEKIDFEDQAMDEIYSLSEGCARDALSILDQLSKSTEKITLNSILNGYNIISNKTVQELLDCTTKGDVQKIIEIIEEFENTGMNAQKLLKKIIDYFEKIAINIKLNKTKEYSFEILKNLIENLNKCYIDARINENVFTIIKMCFLQEIKTPNENMINESKIEKPKKIKETNTSNNENANTKMQEQSDKKNNQNHTLTEIRINNCFVEVKKEELKELTDVWNNLKKLNAIDIRDYKPVAASHSYAIFTATEHSLADLFNIKSSEIEKSLKRNKKNVKVVAITTDEWDKEKEKYKHKLQKKEVYTYIEEPTTTEENTELKEQLDTLFAKKIVEIT